MDKEGSCNVVRVGSVVEAYELLESATGAGRPKGFEDDVEGKPHELQVALLRGFFRGSQIDAIHEVAFHPEVKRILDRDRDLLYVHKAYRIEKQLREKHAEILDRLLQVAHGLDGQLWHAIRPDHQLEPEIEYIVYDVAQLGRPGRIAPHCDNKSMVSMVIMLSDPAEFQGGVNCFEGSSPDKPRMVKLERGDAVFFHGDACMHWITQVTAGRRVICQMELSNCRRRRGCNFCLWLTFAALFMFIPAMTVLAGTQCWQIWLSLPVVLVVEVVVGVAMWRANHPDAIGVVKQVEHN